VGEYGPELFVPDENGNILPNHALNAGGSLNSHIGSITPSQDSSGGGITINVDVHGNSIGTSQQDTKTFAQQIAQQVSQVLGNTARRQGLTHKGVTIPG
jgi:hypothetical protein